MRSLRFLPLPIVLVAFGCSSGDFNTADPGTDDANDTAVANDTAGGDTGGGTDTKVDKDTTPDDTSIAPDSLPPPDTAPDSVPPIDIGVDTLHDSLPPIDSGTDGSDGRDTTPTDTSTCILSSCTAKPTCFDPSCSTGSCSYTENSTKCTGKPACYNRNCSTDVSAGVDGCSYGANNALCTAPPATCYDATCNASDPTAGGDGCAYKANSGKCADAYSCTADVCAAPGTAGTDTGGCTHAAIAGACDDATGCSVGSCAGICTAIAGTPGPTGAPAVTCGATGTGCRYVLNDADHDGYAYSASSDNCTAKGAVAPGRDCNDGESHAYPGETTFFTTVMSGSYTMSSSDPQASKFDYSCDGVAETQFKPIAACSGSTSTSPTLKIGWYPTGLSAIPCGSTGGCGAANCWVTGCKALGTKWVLPDPILDPDFFTLQTQACR